MEKHKFVLPILTEETLRAFIKYAWGISIPDTQVCQNHSTPWRAFVDAYFARSPVSVWHGSRGFAGKSFTLALLSMTEAVTLGADVNVLGGSGEQSKRVLEHMQNLWNYESAPRNMLQADAATVTRLTNGAKVSALMASQASVRGPHPQRLRLDEIDEMDIRILDAAMGQTMSKGDIKSQTVMSSTRQYSDGTMQEILRRAGEKGWKVHEWCVHSESVIMSPSGDKPIKTIEIGDIIYAYKDGRIIETTVSDVWSNGKRETISIVCQDGRRIICTPEHKIATTGGWKNAGSLIRGEILRGVRKEDWEAWQGEQNQNGDVSRVPTEKQENSGISWKLSDMWKAKTNIVKDLFGVLSGWNDKEKYSGCWEVGACERKPCTYYEKQYQQNSISDKGIIGLSWFGVRTGSSIWALFCGLCNSVSDGLHRGKWRLLALKARADETRLFEENRDRGARIQNDCSARGQATFLDSAIVERIESHPSVDVWDMTVKDGESFVCGGIVVHNCFRETAQPHGWLMPADIEQKRSDVTAAMWVTEYENQEPNPSSRAIQPGAVDIMFDKSLGEFDGAAHEYIEIEAPIPTATYAHGADWARKGDWTIITTYRTDVRPVKCVAWERTGRLDWPVMVKKFDDRILRFGGRGMHDGTGLGDVVDGYMTSGAQAFIMAGRARADLLSEYINACEKGDIVYPFIRYAYQEHKFASVEAVMSGGTEHLPDSISAGALGWRCVSKIPVTSLVDWV